jgi:hypothetical protein
MNRTGLCAVAGFFPSLIVRNSFQRPSPSSSRSVLAGVTVPAAKAG